MKRFAFAVVAGGLIASAVAAQTAPARPVATPAPVVGAAPAVVGSPLPVSDVFATPTTAPARRGLFGRLRTRGTSGGVMSATPLTTAPLTPGTVITNPGTVVPAPTTAPGAAVPSPMPPVAPTPRGMSSAMPTVVGNPVVAAGGTTGGMVTPAGGTTTSGGTVVQLGGTVIDANGTVMPVAGTSGTTPMVMGNGMMMGGSMTTSAPVMMTTATTSTGRMGLIARIRARR